MIVRKFGLVLTLFWVSGFISLAFAAVPPETSDSQNQELAVVDGFRSAKFGITEQGVYDAISKDFNISRSSVEKTENALEKTTSLAVVVPKLLSEGGKSKVVYILGYRSKRLIQVNVIWGKPVNENPDAQGIVATANLLREYFFRKGFKKDDLVMNARLNDGSVLVFRGSDKQGRMVILLLNTPQKQNENQDQNINQELSLRLSYIENANDPDIFRIKEGEF